MIIKINSAFIKKIVRYTTEKITSIRIKNIKKVFSKIQNFLYTDTQIVVKKTYISKKQKKC